MRFTTQELMELDRKIAQASERALAREEALFGAMSEAILAQTAEIRRIAQGFAALDVIAALAEIAARRDWVRPAVDSSLDFEIEAGRHPVVEAALKAQGKVFAPNDCALSGGKIAVVTGPNMAGKSTFLRQNALIALLAQAGSYVPAAKAHIGVVDRLFSRVGASDDLARGRSTFMVEMVETATILNSAGAAFARHPRRDRARHGDLRRSFDRLGGDRASLRGQSLARALRHAFSRADATRETTAKPRQPHDEGFRARGRDRLPARGRRGSRGSLLRRACRRARRPTEERRDPSARDFERARGAGSARAHREDDRRSAPVLAQAAAAGAQETRCARPWRRSSPTL